MLPLMDTHTGQDVAVIVVQPDTAPQDASTTQLFERLRTETLPAATRHGRQGLRRWLPGRHRRLHRSWPTRCRVPAVVVGLGFLMLLVLFRRSLVPLTGRRHEPALARGLARRHRRGVPVGLAQRHPRLTGTGPIFPFLPVMVFAILFGLSMDYQVFLVSRMHEEWGSTRDNRSVRRGSPDRAVSSPWRRHHDERLRGLHPGPDKIIKLFGVSLTSAVLVDALLVRLIFVPSLMSISARRTGGCRAGWRPRLPHFEVEGGGDEITETSPTRATRTRSSSARSTCPARGPGTTAEALSPPALGR